MDTARDFKALTMRLKDSNQGCFSALLGLGSLVAFTKIFSNIFFFQWRQLVQLLS